MRLELGMLTLEVEKQEEAADFVRGLLRHLNNQEVAQLLGVTDKTVRRWKREGRLPSREGGQIMLLDLLQHLHPRSTPTGPATAAPAVPALASRPSRAGGAR